MPKDWTEKMTKKNGAAAQFLQAFDKPNNEEAVAAEHDNEGQDYLDKVLKEGKPKHALILTGLYLEPDLAKVLDQLGKKGGRGAKSHIANDALRKYFKDKGLMD